MVCRSVLWFSVPLNEHCLKFFFVKKFFENADVSPIRLRQSSGEEQGAGDTEKAEKEKNLARFQGVQKMGKRVRKRKG